MKKIRPNFLTAAVCLNLILASLGQANVGSEFGMGSRSAGLGGSSVSWNFDGYTTFVNPALLSMAGHDSARPNTRLVLSYGLVFMSPHFKDINNVLVQNKYDSDQDVTGNVDTSYRHTLGQELGVVLKAFPEFLNLTFGVSAYFPIDQLAYVDTGASDQPEYFLYRDRTQTPQLDIAMGGEISRALRFGIGLHTAYTLTGNAQATLYTSNNPSTARFSASLKPKLIPFFGASYSETDDFSLGLVVRLEATSDSTVNVTGGTRASFLPTIPFSFTSASSLLYEPLSIELGTSFKTSDDYRTYLEADYQFWSKFRASALVIQNGCATQADCGITISPGPSYDYGYRNILIPRIAEELTQGTTKYRIAYGYRQSVLKDPPNGAGNYLDPSKHMFNAGMSLEFNHFVGYDVPWRLDLNAAYQLLVAQTILKTPGDETGNPSDSKIGSPGYEAGGSVWGGGASLTFTF